MDLCGNVLLVVNDREAKDLGSIMYVIDISTPTQPAVEAVLPLGLTGSGRGSGHIANFVKPDCSQAWVDGGDHVEVVDLTDPKAPHSLGKFESRRVDERRLQGVARHRARQHRHGLERRRRRRGRVQAHDQPAEPAAPGDHRRRGPQPVAVQRLHPPQLAAPRQDAARDRGGLHRHRRGAAGRLPRPGQVRDLGHLQHEERRDHAAGHLGDRAERHVHRRRGRLEGAGDRQLLVALVRRARTTSRRSAGTSRAFAS